jgi:integrase
MPKKRADGRYSRQIVIGIQENGKPKKKTLYAKTIKELDAKEREYRGLIEKGVYIPSKSITVNELMQQWKNNKLSVQDSSLRIIEMDIKKISNFIGIMKVSDVRLFHLEAFSHELSKTLSPASTKAVIIRLKQIFRYAVEKDLIIKNPAEFIETPKTVPPIKRMLTDSEKTLIEKASLNPMEKCFVYMLRYTGMRRGEILALQVNDIDLKLRTINVSKTVDDGRGKPYVKNSTKTKAGIRTVPILDPLYPILKSYCANKIGLLFHNSKGGCVNSQWIHHTWIDIRKKLATANNDTPIADDVTPHIFRHTFASDLYAAGIDIKRAQYILGHGDIKTTLSIYTHFDKEKLRVDEMNNFYSQSKVSQTKSKNA